MGYFGQRGRDFGTLNRGMAGLGADGYSGDLSVKFYTGKGWASYQSPESDRTLRALERELKRGGVVAIENGIIDDVDVAAARLFAARNIADTRSLVGMAGRIDQTARSLAALASSQQMLAERGNVAFNYVKAINDAHALPAVAMPELRNSPAVPGAPAPVQPPPLPPPGGDAWYKTPLGIAAIAVGGGLAYVTFIKKGGGRRRRS